jgi:hypothetical protein
MKSADSVRKHALELLKGGEAHVDFQKAVKDFPAEKRGVKPPGAAHSAWELLEHLRLAQLDILEFSRNPRHVSPKWPEGYWPESPSPSSAKQWDESVSAFERDTKELEKLVADPSADLLAPFPHSDGGQTLLREALLAADHNSYHLGQLVVLRRALGTWPET